MALAGVEAVGTGGQSERYLADARPLARGLQTTARETSSSGSRSHFDNNEEMIYIYAKNLLIW